MVRAARCGARFHNFSGLGKDPNRKSCLSIWPKFHLIRTRRRRALSHRTATPPRDGYENAPATFHHAHVCPGLSLPPPLFPSLRVPFLPLPSSSPFSFLSHSPPLLSPPFFFFFF